MTTPAANQTLQAITLAQWLPVLQRWLGLRNALVVGQSQQALRLLNSGPEACTLFKAGSPVASPAANSVAHAPSSHAAANTRHWLIAEHTGPATFHQVNLPSENGLLPATALTACWPGIKPVGQHETQALSLDDAYAQAMAEHAWASPPQWLWIGCLPATSLLRGATQVLQQTDVVLLRVQLHLEAHPDGSLHSAQALLQAHGFALCGVELERNPHLGTALFVRDYSAAHMAAHQQRDELTQAHAEIQARLSVEIRAREAEAGAKIEAQRERDELAHAHAELVSRLSAETQAKQAEAETRVAAQQQVQCLAQATEQALAQKQALLQEITSLQQMHAQESEVLCSQVESLNVQVHVLQSQAQDLSKKLEQSQQLQAKTQDEFLSHKTLIEDFFTTAEAQIDLIKELVLVEHSSLNAQSIDQAWASDASVQSFSDPDQEVGEPGDIDRHLLQRTITQWQFGDWNSLSQLNHESIKHHPDRAKLVLLGAAGRLQTDQIDEAKQYIRFAKDWGVSKKLLTRILAAGVHNSLGHAAALAGEQHRAIQHFQSALATGTPGSEDRLFVQVRINHQYQQQGLSPVAIVSLS